MNVKALEELKRVVRDAPEELFHMKHIVDTNADCGTARCAIGWAIIDPWFREHTPLGSLVAVTYPNNSAYVNLSVIAAEVFDVDVGDLGIVFGYDLDWPAGADPHAISKKDVLDNIDRLLNGEEPEQYELPDDEDEEDDD